MKLNIREIAVFGMLGALMFASKKLMEFLPNVHLLGVFIIAFTVVYRLKALYPIYIYVVLDGIFSGFNLWWIPYLYIWTLLWGAVMLLPKKLPKKAKPFVYMALCGLHGFLFGILYAPAQAIFFRLSFDATLTWIAAGLPFDIVHGISNLVCGMLICPIIALLRKSEKFTI
ncbi:MAG: hypothetical protein E7532_06115 [Ruminococcaceae bacterium]|nr:hypothetical protein [Oscillospiraceae bacterium]